MTGTVTPQPADSCDIWTETFDRLLSPIGFLGHRAGQCSSSALGTNLDSEPCLFSQPWAWSVDYCFMFPSVQPTHTPVSHDRLSPIRVSPIHSVFFQLFAIAYWCCAMADLALGGTGGHHAHMCRYCNYLFTLMRKRLQFLSKVYLELYRNRELQNFPLWQKT